MCTEKDTACVYYRKRNNAFPMHHENAGTYSHLYIRPAVGMGGKRQEVSSPFFNFCRV